MDDRPNSEHDAPVPVTVEAPPSPRTFRLFFLRGLAVLLPTVLTIWLLVVAFKFVSEKIAEPINRGVRYVVVLASPWPKAIEKDYAQVEEEFKTADAYAAERAEWRGYADPKKQLLGKDRWEQVQDQEMQSWLTSQRWYHREARRRALARWWGSVRIFGYAVMDLVGLVLAVLLIYFAGLFLGSYFGRRLFRRGEELLRRTPVFKQVYPYIKQVTDFFVGEGKARLKFNRVVAVEYPRKGLWSLGLVTGDTLRTIQASAGQDCITVFIPSSPTPFTGYVVTVPRKDTIDLDISIDEALRFTVSGGVIVPDSQLIEQNGGSPAPAEPTPGRVLPQGRAVEQGQPDGQNGSIPVK